MSSEQPRPGTEFLAGLTTFAAMAYIIILNPQILGQAGMDFDSVLFATIIASAFSTLLMGLWANYPFALAPGMGINAYFAFGVVLSQGVSWQIALGICFWSAMLLLLFNSFGWRERILHAIPHSLQLATAGGIGLFLIFIGLQNIALIAPNEATIVSLGNILAPEALLALLGIAATAALVARSIRGAILWVILALTVIGWVSGLHSFHGLTALPTLPETTFLQLDLFASLAPQMWPYILTFLFIGLLDTAGTIIALGQQGMFIKERKIPLASRVLGCDAAGTVVTSLLGSSPITTYLESGAGIAAGGRTGRTAVVVACCFLLALFFRPFIESIPLFATAPALILVGAMMLQALREMEWGDTTETLPAILTLAIIPLTFSIATGLAIGFTSYPIIKVLAGKPQDTSLFLWITAALFATKFLLI